MKKLLFVSLFVASAFSATSSYATTDSISLTATPKVATILSDGTGLNGLEDFGLSGPNFPPNTLNLPKKLTSVNYHIATYVGAPEDSVSVCYYQPYQANYSFCTTMTAGTTGTTSSFNSFPFDNGSKITITHSITGATPGQVLQPSGQETVTYNFSY